MSTPIDAAMDAFQKAFKDIWGQASMMIMAIIMLLVFLAVFAIWIEWKSYGRRN